MQNSGEKKRSEKQRRKGKTYPSEYRFLRIAMRDKKAFPNEQCKETDENYRMGKTRDLFKKIRSTREHFTQRWAQKKDRNGMNLTEAEGIKKRWQEYTELYKKIFIT